MFGIQGLGKGRRPRFYHEAAHRANQNLKTRLSSRAVGQTVSEVALMDYRSTLFIQNRNTEIPNSTQQVSVEEDIGLW